MAKMNKDDFREAQTSLLMQIVSQLTDISYKLDALVDPPKTEKVEEDKPKEEPFKFEFDKSKVNEAFKKVEDFGYLFNEASKIFGKKS